MILISDSAFDPWSYLAEYQRKRADQAGQSGATAVFVGTLRALHEGDKVQGMLLEHFPGMTENYLEKISQEAVQRW